MTDPATDKLSVPVDDGTQLGLFVARPSGTPRGALIVLQEIWGVNAHIRDVTTRFAREGWLCAAPDLYHRQEAWWEGEYSDYAPGVTRASATTQEQIRADLRATHAWLARETANGKIGAIGFCMGGRQAYVANGILPLACAVSFYGSNIVGLPDLAATQSGPILLAWGAKDHFIDAAQRRAVVDLLEGAKKAYVDVTFGEADHGFFCDARANYHAGSAKVAWGLVKEFLTEQLG